MSLPYVFCIVTLLPEREKSLGRMLSEISQHGAQDIVISSQDRNKTFYASIENSCRMANSVAKAKNYNWIVRMDDDVFCSPEFGVIIHNTLLSLEIEDGVKLVTFYSNSKEDIGLYGIRKIKNVRNRYGDLCVAVRPDVLNEFFDTKYWDSWLLKFPQHQTGFDICFSSFLADKKYQAVVFAPSQVQHADIDSTLGHKRGKRQSRSYTKEYGEIARG